MTRNKISRLRKRDSVEVTIRSVIGDQWSVISYQESVPRLTAHCSLRTDYGSHLIQKFGKNSRRAGKIRAAFQSCCASVEMRYARAGFARDENARRHIP